MTIFLFFRSADGLRDQCCKTILPSPINTAKFDVECNAPDELTPFTNLYLNNRQELQFMVQICQV